MSGQIVGAPATMNFIALDGQPDLPGLRITSITRKNVDGMAWRVDGRRGEPFQLTGVVDVDNAVGIQSALAFYKSVKSSIVQFTLSDGRVYNNYMVLDVKSAPSRRLTTAAGGLSTGKQFLVRSVWTLQYIFGV